MSLIQCAVSDGPTSEIIDLIVRRWAESVRPERTEGMSCVAMSKKGRAASVGDWVPAAVVGLLVGWAAFRCVGRERRP